MQRAQHPAIYRQRLTGQVARINLLPTTVGRLVTYPVRVALDPTDQPVRVGMTATVVVAQEAPGKTVTARLEVPLTAIFQQDGKPAVWVVGADQTVALRPVTVAVVAEDRAELSGGVLPGERIVVNGLQHVRPGAVVAPQPVAMSGGKAS